VSKFDARYARAHGYQPGDRLLALPNPLPDDWLDLPPRAEPARVIGFFGNFTPVKGADLLRVLLPRLLRDHPAWRVRLVGGNLPAANGWGVELAPRIEVIPFVRAKDQLRDIYRTTAIALVPSIYESFGLVAAEAMACGCAVVAAPTGWAADLTENEVVTVRSRDPADWTAAIAGLLRDDARRRSLASAARARVQTLRWSSALDRLEAFYARLLAARKHQPDAGG
jgi:D-inositol-3-phosphate glycosyltransferase